MSFFHSAYYAYAGLPGPLTVVNAISKDAQMSFIGEIIGCAIAAVIAIVLIQMIGFDDPVSKDAVIAGDAETKDVKATVEEVSEIVSDAAADKTVMSPLSGEVIPLSEVKDEVFSSEAMGKGCAVIPAEGKVYAPFDGMIVGLLESHHAVGLESENGIEILIYDIGTRECRDDCEKSNSCPATGNRRNKEGNFLQSACKSWKNDCRGLLCGFLCI